MARREFLQLARKFDPSKQDVSGWFVSEKLDGTRCLWDGGLTRGLPTELVPWASVTDPKTGQRKKKIKPRATGLWSRYGNPIMAPDWFLNQLPCCPLDGELWAGRGKFQLCRSICGGDAPDPRFDQIVYAVYSSPPLAQLFSTGEIKNTNMVCPIDLIAVEHWIKNRLEEFDDDYCYLPPGSLFQDELKFLEANLENTDFSVCYLHTQRQVDNTHQVDAFLDHVIEQGGEGVVVRDPGSLWVPKRHRGLLKYKPYSDAEGTVTGFTSGRETNKGSKLLGMIGALILDFKGKRLELAGLTDEERTFAEPYMIEYAQQHPGIDMPSHFAGKHFRVGQIVTFKYRELSDDGIPKEARYFRKRGKSE
jgi:DNA ligase-1